MLDVSQRILGYLLEAFCSPGTVKKCTNSRLSGDSYKSCQYPLRCAANVQNSSLCCKQARAKLSLLSFPQGGRDGCLGSEAAQSETGKPALFRDRNCFKGYLAVGKTTRAELVLTMAIAVQRTRDMVHRMLIWPTVVTTGSAEGGRNMLTVRSRCPGNKLHTVLRP